MATVSIVVPVYKVETYLKRCVDSILSQTFEDFQLILVDDGSPDNCGIICDEYAKKDIRVHVIHRKNGGLSAARNSGIDWVFDGHMTEWITFIDSDDWVSHHYLERLLSFAEKTDSEVCVGGFQSVQDENDVNDENENSIVKTYTPESLWYSNRGNATVAWGKLYKTHFFKELRYPEGKIHEDEFTTYKILFSQNQIAYCEEKLYNYYLSPNSIMRSKWSIKLLDGIEALEEQMLFFKTNRYKMAFYASEKDHTFTSYYILENIKTSDTPKEYLDLFYKRISCFFINLYGCNMFKYIFICRGHLFFTKMKIIIKGKVNSLRDVKRE